MTTVTLSAAQFRRLREFLSPRRFKAWLADKRIVLKRHAPDIVYTVGETIRFSGLDY